MPVKVSVVIPAFNEEKNIEKTLFSLLKSEQETNINYEVILVDNNSTDKTVEIAKKFSAKGGSASGWKDGMDLKIIKETIQGRGAARARGFAEAKGEIILSTDADVNVYKDWVEILALELKKDVVAVTTACKVVDSSILNNILFNIFMPVNMILYKVIVGHFWLSGFSFGIKREIYLKAGGFDESLHAQEDTDLAFRVAKLGKIKFINKPIIVSGRRLKKGILKAYFDYLASYFNVFFKKNDGYLDNPR